MPFSMDDLLIDEQCNVTQDKPHTQGASQSPSFEGLRVLIAEDNEVNKIVAEHQLKSLGCTVKGAIHGQETVENFLAEPFDLILMDCQMPVMDGFEATSHIRMLQAGTGNRIPIVAMTAFTSEYDRKACLAAGMDDFMPKPISKKMVVQVLTRTLTRLRGRHKLPFKPTPYSATP